MTIELVSQGVIIGLLMGSAIFYFLLREKDMAIIIIIALWAAWFVAVIVLNITNITVPFLNP